MHDRGRTLELAYALDTRAQAILGRGLQTDQAHHQLTARPLTAVGARWLDRRTVFTFAAMSRRRLSSSALGAEEALEACSARGLSFGALLLA